MNQFCDDLEEIKSVLCRTENWKFLCPMFWTIMRKCSRDCSRTQFLQGQSLWLPLVVALVALVATILCHREFAGMHCIFIETFISFQWNLELSDIANVEMSTTLREKNELFDTYQDPPIRKCFGWRLFELHTTNPKKPGLPSLGGPGTCNLLSTFCLACRWWTFRRPSSSHC